MLSHCYCNTNKTRHRFRNAFMNILLHSYSYISTLYICSSTNQQEHNDEADNHLTLCSLRFINNIQEKLYNCSTEIGIVFYDLCIRYKE